MRNEDLTRREALAGIAFGGAVLLAGCGTTGVARRAAADGSSLHSTYADPTGDGQLQASAGAPLIDRTDLAPRALFSGELARIAHLTDAHVLDEQSPARVTFLNRLGPPFDSTFRPHETLTSQVLAGAVRAINAFGPEAVIQGGDLIDNAQDNELDHALAILRGARVSPGSGAGGYIGVQSADNPDPFYYRPDVDAPRHPGMLAEAQIPFHSPGLSSPSYPVLGDHDTLVQGVIPPNPTTEQIALGTRAVYELPAGLVAPRGFSTASGSSPDGVADPTLVNRLILQALSAPSVTVPANPARRELSVPEVLARLRRGSAHAGTGSRLDYSFDVGRHVRVIVLDLVRRDGGSGGVVHPGQARWLARELRHTEERWVLVVCHQPLISTEGAARLLAQLDRHPRIVAAIWGHTHRNQISARPTPAGGYWLISTCSLIDYPQQARALRLMGTVGGGVALQTWMLDHAPDGGLGDISRELAYLDAQGGRPQNFAGGPLDRNVTLYKGPQA